MAIFIEFAENERIIDRHVRDMPPLLDYDALCHAFCLSVLGVLKLYGKSHHVPL